MCVICDGMTREEVFSGEFVRIAVNGFTMIQVEANPRWTYTIGLVQSFSHPELVVTGLPGAAGGLITDVVERIRDGQRFDADSTPLTLCDCCTSVAFGAVHTAQWEFGRFNQWLNYYGRLGGELPIPDAVQVLWHDEEGRFPPDRDFCPAHGGTCQPLLDEPPKRDVNADRFP